MHIEREADVLTIVAHINFQSYQITLGDLLYLYRLLPKSNWGFMKEQAKKYKWLRTLERTIALIQGIHEQLYTKTESFGSGLKYSIGANPNFPYVLSFADVFNALTEKGLRELQKMPSYFSIRLKKYPAVRNAYCRVVVHELAKYYINHSIGKVLY